MIRNSNQLLLRDRAGFSFTEILFAVMILGIGFIMVAAMFPVAIKQTQETVEETTAANVAKGAASYLQRVGTNSSFPPTNGKVVNYAGAAPSATAPGFWQAVNGNLILPTDSRYAWIPFYSRNVVTDITGAVVKDSNGNPVGSPYAQVTIISVQVRNSSSFTSADLAGTTQANLTGRPALATFSDGGTANPDTINFTADTGGPSSPTSNIAEGAYVVVADDSALSTVAANPLASCNGFVYRIGIPSGTAWELLPGSDMKNSRYKPTGSPGVHVFIVGRGYSNSSSTAGIAGPAMDVAAYSTFIQVRADPTTGH